MDINLKTLYSVGDVIFTVKDNTLEEWKVTKIFITYTTEVNKISMSITYTLKDIHNPYGKYHNISEENITKKYASTKEELIKRLVNQM